MKHLCRILSVLLLLIVILLYLPLTLPQLFGYDCSAVVSASMEPAIKKDGLVYYRSALPEALREGDVIVFRTSYGSGVSDVTHRVVSNDVSARQVTTKGDANPGNDFSPISYDLIRGLVVKSIPFGGNLALFLTSDSGKWSMAGLLIPAVLFRIAAGLQPPRWKRYY